MSQFDFNSFIDFVAEFFSDLPPKAVAIISAIAFVALMVFCGFTAAFVLGILSLFISQSGILLVVIYVLYIAGFSIFGLIKGYLLYKKSLHGYETSQN